MPVGLTLKNERTHGDYIRSSEIIFQDGLGGKGWRIEPVSSLNLGG